MHGRWYRLRDVAGALLVYQGAEAFHGAGNAPAEEYKVTEGPSEQVLVSLAGAAGLSLSSTSTLS